MSQGTMLRLAFTGNLCSLWQTGIVFAFACSVSLAQDADSMPQRDFWPQWRGPNGTGVSETSQPPIHWSPTENVVWKTPIPGKGHSTPVVWGNAIFVTTATPIGEKFTPKMSGRPGEHDNAAVDSTHEFSLIAIDRETGKIRWQRSLHRAIPIEAGHVTASLASASPVADAEFVFAHFGSHGLYCLDHDGNTQWKLELGTMHSKHGHGEGSSPVLFGETLIINWDHEEGSFVTALNKRTGQERWRKSRTEDTSWSSPIIIKESTGSQVIVCGTNRVRGYDLDTGSVIWECEGMSSNVVATPVYSDGMLYAGSSYEKRILMALDIRGAKGNITNTPRVKWSRTRGTPYVPSMLLYQDSLYFLSHYQNLMTRVHGPSGNDSPGVIRLGGLGNIYASPVAADNHLYVTDLDGKTAVVSHSDIPRIVALNDIGEPVSASLALVGNSILIRGESHLFCIEAR